MNTKTAIITMLASASIAQVCTGQCRTRWWAFGRDKVSLALTTWDADGAGPGRHELVSGLVLPVIPGQGSPTRVSRYDAQTWRNVGGQLWGIVWETFIRAIVVVDSDGTGSPLPGLYAAGQFQETNFEPAMNIVHWDGTRWRPFGETVIAASLYTLAMFDEDGSGPKEPNLFVGGAIIDISNGITQPGVVRWDGTTYSKLGSDGLTRYAGTNPSVLAMLVFDDDGPGPNQPALYVGGSFHYVEGQPSRGVARWTGTQWETLDRGLDFTRDLIVYDADGDGPQPPMLYAGGAFTIRDPQGNAIGNNLARWNGSTWEPVPGWDGGSVTELGVFDPDGDGPLGESLIVSGLFRIVNGRAVNYIVQWDGQQTWRPMGTGLYGLSPSWATDMQVYDEDGDPSTPDGLYIAGQFFGAGGESSVGFARWGCPSPICYADCDESTGLGLLDMLDFLCFQAAFTQGDPYACDCDTSTGNGVCDIFDFLCFQNAFVNGCP